MANSDAKDFYNETMPGKFGADYEHERWHKGPIEEAGYKLTREAILRHVVADDTLDPLRVLELGQGAGTWTKILLNRFPDAYFDLLDISKEMLARAKAALGEREKVRYVESDILAWEPDGVYDLFFSSRVIEYIDNKPAFAKKVFSALPLGGRGFLITKMPHYERDRYLGREVSKFHTGQIAPAALMQILREAGFIDVACYPVTLSIPLLHSARLNYAVGKLLGPYRLGLFGMAFAESYCVLFRKPKL